MMNMLRSDKLVVFVKGAVMTCSVSGDLSAIMMSSCILSSCAAAGCDLVFTDTHEFTLYTAHISFLSHAQIHITDHVALC